MNRALPKGNLSCNSPRKFLIQAVGRYRRPDDAGVWRWFWIQMTQGLAIDNLNVPKCRADTGQWKL